MREVKYIELVTENCEVIRIDREHIGHFRMSNITRSIARRASNSISESLSTEEIFLQVSSKANTTDANVCTWEGNDTLPFDRLQKHHDIVAIDVIFQDGSNEYIYGKWGGDSEYTNENQTVSVNENTGDLYLVISEKDNVQQHFTDLLEEDEDDTFWDLYS
ncbi:hypothetical protein MOB72_08110 [Bacillus licheniformis]|uniref:hypothetical protein n=1 Tax=Bacillus licheniformis TaxID=1402 RepID=UPI00092866F7|nr:hypothetical protein [Bacillus licheniformis]MCY7954716.1 hypothetical protein [Bacillus licheniformis]MCY9220548.1 hypothetical protein [Bacillus licheniformis]MEC1349109.1 hypothetical protein [Bacillus licheniformis]OJT53888.1 hypothetical protein BFP47_23355 [Bacillus licheniformis]OJT67885.1 hypothetical protein BFP46_15390 [Bacillus licheniformis]